MGISLTIRHGNPSFGMNNFFSDSILRLFDITVSILYFPTQVGLSKIVIRSI